MRRAAAAATMMVMAMAAQPAVQERSSAWLGVPLPSGLGDPHRPVVSVGAVRPPAPRIPPGEEGSRFGALAGARIRQDVETITGFSKKSRAARDRVWGRVTGFPAAVETAGWVAAEFKAAGLTGVEIQTYEASAPMWWATSWDVRVIGDPAFGPGSADVVLESAVPTSGSTIAGGTLSGPLALVGSVTDAALPDVDVKGKIAVQRLTPSGGAYSERGRTTERARALTKRGAVAVLNVVAQTGNMHVRDFGNCGVPCFNVGTEDGRFVEAVIARAAGGAAAPRVQLRLDARAHTGLKGQNVVGIVPGRSGASGENIIVNAHLDGWYDAAGDNGDGLAVLVAMARYFAKAENRVERSLVFVASGGHHSTGLNGPQNFVKMNGPLTAATVMVLNLEHVAQLRINSSGWAVDAAEQPMNFGISNQSPLLVRIGKAGVERYGFNLNPTFSASVPGDLGGYAPLNVARVQAIHSGPMYHTSGDVADTISVPGLERAARFFSYFVTEAAKRQKTEINP